MWRLISLFPSVFPEGHGEDKDADDYYLYITNLPREEFLPSDLATLYCCRWEVEAVS